MKIITKSGLAVTLFMATAVFNSAMAQKFEFKATWVKGSSGSYQEVDQKDNSFFVIDFDNKKFEGPQGELLILSEIMTQDYRTHSIPKDRSFRYLFAVGEKTAAAEIILSIRTDSQPKDKIQPGRC